MRSKRIKIESNQSATMIKSLYDNRDGTYTVLIEKLNYDLEKVSEKETNFKMFGEALASYHNWSKAV